MVSMSTLKLASLAPEYHVRVFVLELILMVSGGGWCRIFKLKIAAAPRRSLPIPSREV
jgi:hypothetical protein